MDDESLERLIQRTGAKTIAEYEPGLGVKFDGLICHDLDKFGEAAIDELFATARRFVWASVRRGEKPFAWWGCRFASAGVRTLRAWTLVEM